MANDSSKPGKVLRIPVTPTPTRTASDATGINVADRAPIDPRMPHMPPA